MTIVFRPISIDYPSLCLRSNNSGCQARSLEAGFLHLNLDVAAGSEAQSNVVISISIFYVTLRSKVHCQISTVKPEIVFTG